MVQLKCARKRERFKGVELDLGRDSLVGANILNPLLSDIIVKLPLVSMTVIDRVI